MIREEGGDSLIKAITKKSGNLQDLSILQKSVLTQLLQGRT